MISHLLLECFLADAAVHVHISSDVGDGLLVSVPFLGMLGVETQFPKQITPGVKDQVFVDHAHQSLHIAIVEISMPVHPQHIALVSACDVHGFLGHLQLAKLSRLGAENSNQLPHRVVRVRAFVIGGYTCLHSVPSARTRRPILWRPTKLAGPVLLRSRRASGHPGVAREPALRIQIP